MLVSHSYVVREMLSIAKLTPLYIGITIRRWLVDESAGLLNTKSINRLLIACRDKTWLVGHLVSSKVCLGFCGMCLPYLYTTNCSWSTSDCGWCAKLSITIFANGYHVRGSGSGPSTIGSKLASIGRR